MASPNAQRSLELERQTLNGWAALVVVLFWFIAALALFGSTISEASDGAMPPSDVAFRILAVVLMAALGIFLCCGFFTLQPNEARVLILFGDYKGTVRRAAFTGPIPSIPAAAAAVPRLAGRGNAHQDRPGIDGGRQRVAAGSRPSSRCARATSTARSSRSTTSAATRSRSPPSSSGASRTPPRPCSTSRTTRATSQIQSESAIRQLASRYAYDHGEEHELTLRGGADEVAHALKEELQERLAKAGVVVDEARLTHLAYAPEIAPAMLRRQQAEAVIAARKKIVHGAVSMVRDGAARARRKRRREARRGTQGRDGQQPARRALRQPRMPRRSSTPARSTPDRGTERAQTVSAADPARTSGRSSRNGRRTTCAASTGRSNICCERRSRGARLGRRNPGSKAPAGFLRRIRAGPGRQ